jgi:hypothetical protein
MKNPCFPRPALVGTLPLFFSLLYGEGQKRNEPLVNAKGSPHQNKTQNDQTAAY